MIFENYNPDSMVLGSLADADLSPNSYMVMGSGILDALGIRGADDIDLVVSSVEYKRLQVSSGWGSAVASNGTERLEKGIYQVYNEWFDEKEVKTVADLLLDADWINGVAFNSLDKLVFYKQRRGREKDLKDIKMIKRYLQNTDLDQD